MALARLEAYKRFPIVWIFGLLPKFHYYKVIGYGQEMLANDVTESIQWEENALTFDRSNEEGKKVKNNQN